MGRRRCRCAQKTLTFNSEIFCLWLRRFSFPCSLIMFPVLAAVSITPILEGISHLQGWWAALCESSCDHQKSSWLVKSNSNVNVCARVIFSYRCRDVLLTLWKHQEEELKQKKSLCLRELDGLLSHCVSRVFGLRWSSQSGTALRTLA